MRFTAFVFLVLCLVALANCANNRTPSPCARDCGDKYDPICAKEKNGNKLLTFGSDCVMSRFNCEHPDGQYELKQKGDCGGNVGVRLS